MIIYQDVEAERERIQNCIQKFGWTSDHNLDWFSIALMNKDGRPGFAQFDDDTGILFHIYPGQWHIWSDPLCPKDLSAEKIIRFAEFGFKENINEIWCNYVSNKIHPILIDKNQFYVGGIDYSLDWPVLNLEKFDLSLPGSHFKEIRNAQNKFNREHAFEVMDFKEAYAEVLHKIIIDWKRVALIKEEEKYVYDFWYHNLVDSGFRNFTTTRVILVDGRPAAFNAGYEVPNKPSRFSGAVGIHDYSVKDLGLMVWLEDFEWIKNAGYKELDMQGSEGGGLKFKMQFNPIIERKTDTFSIRRK